MPEGQHMNDFWVWFSRVETKLRKAYEEGDIDRLEALISGRLDALASGIGWEMGPYALPHHSFVISPGNRERIEICKAIVDCAPALPGWRFFAGKPAKDLLSLTIDVDGAEVCADNWRYRLTSYNGGEFVDLEIFFEADDAPPSEKEDIACELLVESLLGELVSLERVGYIENSRVDRVSDVERTAELRFLKEQLDEVLAPFH
jgi:hypothetical protein